MRETIEGVGHDAVAITGLLPADPIPLVAGIVGIFLLTVLFWYVRRRSADVRDSRRSHQRAKERPPPVDVGDVEELGVTEFSQHHSGERHAVGKVEGFVIFVEDVPGDVDVADVIRVKILSFNRGGTSATATYLGRG